MDFARILELNPDIIRSIEIYNYYGKIKNHSFSSKDPYNFYAMNFYVFSTAYNYI